MIHLLLADSDLKSAIVSGVLRRNSQIDFKRAVDVPLAGLDDSQVLNAAAKEGRILVSHDVNTMPGYFRAFKQHAVSPGLILIPQSLSVRLAIEGLILICDVCNSGDLQNRMCLLPSFSTVY